MPKIDTGAPPELEIEEVVVADVVYPKKGEKESNSPPKIFDIEDDEGEINAPNIIVTTSIPFALVHTQNP